MLKAMSRVLLIGAAIVSALAVFNAIAGRTRTLWNPLTGEELEVATRHGRVRYSRLGAGPPIVLLHGIFTTAWRYEIRQLAERLASEYTVYAPDLVGFGRSDRPALDYTPETYVDVIEDFLQEAVGGEARIFAPSLTASFVMLLARRRPDLVGDMVFSCPIGIEQTGAPGGPGFALLGAALRTPVVGDALFNALTSRPAIRAYLQRRTYFDATRVTDDLVDAYHAAAHQPGARHAPAAFVGGRLNCSVGDVYPYLTQRILVLWGEEAVGSPLTHMEEFRRLRPTTEFEVFERCGIAVHDEQPDRCHEVVRNWLSIGVVEPSEVLEQNEPELPPGSTARSTRPRADGRARSGSSRSPGSPEAGDTSDRPGESPSPDQAPPA